MKRTFTLLALVLLYGAQVMAAEPYRLVSDTRIAFALPSDRWQVSVAPPQLAIDAMYADLVFGKKQKGEPYDPQQLRDKSVDFLRSNNLYIFNEKTEAYLMISIAPFGETSGPPSRKAIVRSAEWAVDAIAEHAGVADTTPYRATLSVVTLPGLTYAVRIDADHPLFGDPHYFIGIIGFSHPYWVFLYYNDKLKDPRDLEEMRRLLATVSFDRV